MKLPMTKSQIQLIRSLADKKTREQSGLFVVEGRKMVDELLNSNMCVEEVFSTTNYPNATQISTKEMERISHLKSPTDSLATAHIPHYNTQGVFDGLVIALDGVQDPGNVGTIIRLADWFGISDILCSESTADCFAPKVIQATMGAAFRVRVHYCDLAKTLKECPTTIFGTFLEGENIYNEVLPKKGVIVMGNEGKGICSEVEKLISRRLFIPPYPAEAVTSESLNVAMATAITLSEFRRKNRG